MVARYRYDRVFLAPPWPKIYETDDDRRHGFDQALTDHGTVKRAYIDAGYQPIMLPRKSVSDRADFILAAPT